MNILIENYILFRFDSEKRREKLLIDEYFSQLVELEIVIKIEKSII